MSELADTPSQSPVSIEQVGKIGYIQISTKLNIFTLDMAEEITQIFKDFIANPKIKVIIFRTSGDRVFSAGWDLAMFQKDLDYAKIDRILRVGSSLTRTIIDCPKPTIAQIQGSVIGYGCILSMACDFRIVADREDLFFQLPELNLGIYPGTGATAAPLKTLGLIPTQEMLLTGNKIPLAKMQSWGGITEIVEPVELAKFTKKYAKNIAKADLSMITLLQKSLHTMISTETKNWLDVENNYGIYYFKSVFKMENRTLDDFLKEN